MFEQMTGLIRSVEDLQRIRESELKKQSQVTRTVLVCGGAGCISCGSKSIHQTLLDELDKAGLRDHVLVKLTGCMGLL